MRLPAYQDLSREQDKALNLPLDGSYLIGGPPGTGKTVIAIYRADMLARADREPRLLMYGNLLSQYTSDATEHLGISAKVQTFHRWFPKYFEANYGRRPPQRDRFEYDWPKIMEIMVAKPPRSGHITHVLVDEGQDLPKEFYSVLQLFVGSNITIFADENQRITETNSTLQEVEAYAGLDSQRTHFLRKNYRNTKEIAELARHFFRGGKTGVPDVPTRTGEKPRVRQLESTNQEVDMIHRHATNFPGKTIGVFVPRTQQQMTLLHGLRKRLVASGSTEEQSRTRVQTYAWNQGERSVDVSKPGIKIVNYQSAKGLEFDAVFMPMLQQAKLDLETDEASMKLYVLISRARDELIMSFSGRSIPALVRALPKNLVSSRVRGV